MADDRCTYPGCAFTGDHDHTAGTPPAEVDWQAVATRLQGNLAEAQTRALATRREADAWRDALNLNTARREQLDNAFNDEAMRLAVCAALRAYPPGSPAEGGVGRG